MKIGRNDRCPCGSGLKYKKCHGNPISSAVPDSNKTANRQYSTLKQHKWEGKKLVPPLSQIPNLHTLSWINDRLPELLWAALLIGQLPRDAALSVFRSVADYIRAGPESTRVGDITHSGLAALPPGDLEDFLNAVVPQPAMSALTPLCLFKSLPARDVWCNFLSNVTEVRGYDTLAPSIAVNLFHQSQEATDCRWLRVIALAAAGQLVLPHDMTETAEEILNYPHRGDMRKVRPTIRSMEGAFATAIPTDSKWPSKFWNQCMSETRCAPLADAEAEAPKPATSDSILKAAFAALVEHAHATQTTTDVDARHDSVFGIGLYSLSIARELLRFGNPSSILARPALRTIVECYVTLAYLLKKDSAELWMSYRAYGAGQAKLSLLKLKESDSVPGSINSEVLEQLANEDRWQEFVPIDVGHWDKSDLRKMSEEAGVKPVYDRLYGWNSTFAHGHWCAIRDSVFVTCANPLHRLHRIPRAEAKHLPDVMQDACETVDLILEHISHTYPTFEFRTTQRS